MAVRSLLGRRWRLPPAAAGGPGRGEPPEAVPGAARADGEAVTDAMARPPGGDSGAGPFARLLRARGIGTQELQPAEPADPFLLPDMEAAVTRLRQAAAAGERVLIFGDYDADGVCATALLARALGEQGIRALPRLPDRLQDGYGLSVAALSEAAAPLVVAVDNGATACAEAAWCRQHGIDLIIADHHLPGPDRPDALAVINPLDPRSRYPFQGLCGAGVAWRLACALGRPPDADADLAAVGTVADVVPLLGENRLLVQRGLARLQAGSGRPGLQALLRRPEPPSARDLAFSVAPRLNAPGRLGDPAPALQLLLADDPGEVAEALAALETANTRRREAQAELAAAAAQTLGGESTPFVYGWQAEWPVGLLGLAAGELVERTGRPAFLLGWQGTRWRGSARAPAGVDVTAALAAASEALARFGGHAGAAGFECDDPEALRRALAALSWQEAPDAVEWPLDGEIAPEELTVATATALQALEPLGAGNPEPRWLLAGAAARQVRTVGQDGRHLKCVLGGVDVIGFGLGYAAAGLREGSRWDACVWPRVDRFGGRERVQLLLHDLRPADGDWAGFLAAFPDRTPLVRAYAGLRRLAGRGPLPPVPSLALGLAAASELPVPTARAAATIFAELGLIDGPNLRPTPVNLDDSASFRFAAQVRRRCCGIIP